MKIECFPVLYQNWFYYVYIFCDFNSDYSSCIFYIYLGKAALISCSIYIYTLVLLFAFIVSPMYIYPVSDLINARFLPSIWVQVLFVRYIFMVLVFYERPHFLLLVIAQTNSKRKQISNESRVLGVHTNTNTIKTYLINKTCNLCIYNIHCDRMYIVETIDVNSTHICRP